MKSLTQSRNEKFLFILVLVLYSYFYGPVGWSQNSRINMIAATVENNPALPLFSIDKYIYSQDLTKNTGDWSYYQGHYYSNKAPFPAMFGIPLYFLITQIETVLKINTQHIVTEIFNFYLLNIFLSILPLAFAAVLFYRIASDLNTEQTALAVSIFLFTGTLLFPFAGGLWGHPTATALLIFTLHQILLKKNFLLAGFFAGLMTGSEYTAGFASLILLFFILWQNGIRSGAKFILGTLPAIITLLWYNWTCFGDPLTTSIAVTNQQFLTASSSLGVLSNINLQNLQAIIFSLQGLLPIMPGFILLPFILLNTAALRRNKFSLLLNLSIFITVLLIISAFNGWHGGASVGPRYLILVMPCLCLLLSLLASIPINIKALYTLTLCSFINMLAIAAVSCLYIDQHSNPLYGGIYKFFLSGKLSPFKGEILLQSFNPEWDNLKSFASFNLGQLLGLSGFYSLIPLMLILLILSNYFLRAQSR